MNTIYTVITHEAQMLPFYLSGIGKQTNQAHVKRQQGFPDYQIACCHVGEGKFLVNGSTYTINKGMGFFFSADLPHEYYATTEPWEIEWVIFRGSQVNPLLELLKLEACEVFHDTNNHISEFIGKLYSEVRSQQETSAAKCSALLFSMLIQLSESLHNNVAHIKNDKHNKLQPVIQLMEQKYNTELSLDEMSAEIQVSRHYLCRLFKETYHTSPFRYLMQLRVQKAKQLISESQNLLMKEIATQTGFHDPSYFCAVFKEFEGVTPIEFRQRHGHGNFLD